MRVEPIDVTVAVEGREFSIQIDQHHMAMLNSANDMLEQPDMSVDGVTFQVMSQMDLEGAIENAIHNLFQQAKQDEEHREQQEEDSDSDDFLSDDI